ncbi:MAG: hypothetical protein QF858_00635 [Candidatus Pacebacteria bacterium]|jgi:hypothetical protein|nr:hypothetical protein [bacterium]MDP6527372.1 hypothetical protein [Candidatus Paceibacterota bacterium]MDP6659499.1 hypothetical protein [Candidatus Paceibacterota bacterium]|tara:strand:- start:47670 stop:48485 length:816 start_codon:yes stop_codon:yes gene_type:complete
MVVLSPLVFTLLLLPPLAAVLLLPIPAIVGLFIVLGQGHFVGSYVYQFFAGRLGWWRVVLYALLFILLWAVFISTKSFDALLALTAVVFTAHFTWDSSHILGNRELLPAVITRLPIFLLFSGFVVEKVYVVPLVPFIVPLVVLLLGIYIFCVALKVFHYDISDFLFMGGALGFLGLISVYPLLSAWIPFGFLILYHYLQWYVFYWKRCASVGKARVRKYIRNMLIVNVVVICLFLFWKFYEIGDMLRYFFVPEYFYLWTLTHIVSSVRLRY